MWKVSLNPSDVESLSALLQDYIDLLPVQENDEREKAVLLKSKLDDLLVEVKEQNRIVDEYIDSIHKRKEEIKSAQ